MKAVQTALNVATIRDLVHPLHPMASVYLGLQPQQPTVDTGEDLGLRWRAITKVLALQGSDQPTIEAIADHIRGLPVFPTELALFAADGRIQLVQQIPGHVHFDHARFSTPAEVVPLLAWLDHHPPYVFVVTDRTGADITAVPGGTSSGSTSVIVGPDDEIERNAPGGWAQARYQRRAEDSWQHNASAVADAAVDELGRLHADLLLVAGDLRAVQLLRERLPHRLRQDIVVEHLPGGRSPDGSLAARQSAIEEAVSRYVAGRDKALMDRFAERGPDRTVEGVPATLAALAAGSVSTLLIAEDPDDERVAWFGPHLLCAAEERDVPEADGSWRASGRMVDVAVRAALLTGADVRVTDSASEHIGDGIGALCRFSMTR